MFPFRARSLKVTVYLSNCCVIHACLLQAMCKFPISTPRGCSPTQFYHQPPGVSITLHRFKGSPAGLPSIQTSAKSLRATSTSC